MNPKRPLFALRKALDVLLKLPILLGKHKVAAVSLISIKRRNQLNLVWSWDVSQSTEDTHDDPNPSCRDGAAAPGY